MNNNNMKHWDTFPCNIEVMEHVEIPMHDGCKLAAKIWLPVTARHEPVPVVLEYIPYRKRDFTAYRDSIMHPYFAGHGFAGVRVDLRGSGDAEGVLEDEYLQQELDDGVEVIKWLASQPWCNGNVGMIGISWGGFNGLQIAYMQPPELKAVVTVCSTDDRYADDVHYMGGCLLSDNLSWASTMFAYNSCPPDPELLGDKWRDIWLERLEGSGLWLKTWLEHQARDDYWKHGSVCEDFSRVKCPVYAVSGWADGYSNAVFRLLQNLDVPRKGLIGAWGHKYPHMGIPGPGMDFLYECVRWWKQWLSDEDTGIMKEPMLRVWMEGSISPLENDRTHPGRWVGEPSWPSPNIETREMILGFRQLLPGDEQAKEIPLSVQSPLSVGLFAGKWCSYSASTDLPSDQREEDGGALIFDSRPLEEPLEILGAPVAEIELSVNKPVAMLVVRLSEKAPDDNTTRVTYGLLNLTHRNSHEKPEMLEPGKRYRIRIQLNDIAKNFPAHHRIRVAISTSYWPLAWPPPEPVKMTVYTGVSKLFLPVRPQRPEDYNMRQFGEPDGAMPIETTIIEPSKREWKVIQDLHTNEATLKVVKDEGVYRIDAHNLEVQKKATENYSYKNNNFNTLRGETVGTRSFRRGDWFVKTITRTLLTSDKNYFYLKADLDAYEGDSRIYTNSWNLKIERYYV